MGTEETPRLKPPERLRDLEPQVLETYQATLNMLGLVYLNLGVGTSFNLADGALVIGELTTTVSTLHRLAMQLEHK